MPIERENKPESLEEEARIEKLVRVLILGERENLATKSGVLRRRRREEGEYEVVNGGASIVVDAAFSECKLSTLCCMYSVEAQRKRRRFAFLVILHFFFIYLLGTSGIFGTSEKMKRKK